LKGVSTFWQIRVREFRDRNDIRWFESSKFPITGNLKQREGNTWKDKRLLSRVAKVEEKKYHFGISGLQRPKEGSDRAFDP
jgi:hypothetical protein